MIKICLSSLIIFALTSCTTQYFYIASNDLCHHPIQRQQDNICVNQSSKNQGIIPDSLVNALSKAGESAARQARNEHPYKSNIQLTSPIKMKNERNKN